MEYKKYIELICSGKYPELWFRELVELRKKARSNLALQKVEIINKPSG